MKISERKVGSREISSISKSPKYIRIPRSHAKFEEGDDME